MPENAPKTPKMAQKWPHRAILGHFGPNFWRFGAFSGHLGLLDVIMGQYAAAGTRIIVPPNVEILALLASFRAIVALFWAVFAPLGPFGAL